MQAYSTRELTASHMFTTSTSLASDVTSPEDDNQSCYHQRDSHPPPPPLPPLPLVAVVHVVVMVAVLAVLAIFAVLAVL